MGQLITLDAGHGIKGILAIDYNPKSDSVKGKLVVPRRGGKPYTLDVQVNLGEIRKQVASLLSNRTGWSLKGAKRALKKATNKAAIMKVLRTTDRIMNDPRFKAGIMAASTVYPPLGITYATIQAGSGIIKAAAAGDPQAQATLATVATMAQAQAGDSAAKDQLANLLTMAQAGHPVASAAVTQVNQMSQGGKIDPTVLLQGMRAIALAQSQGADPAAAISGWFYNRVYRSNLEAKALDTGNPLHVLRGLYVKGSTLEKNLPKRDVFSFFH
jgi:hypothetical protein